MKVTMYTDGSARGNPNGPGGYGTILTCFDKNGIEVRREYSGGFVKTTNNRMELMAAIIGFEQLRFPCEVTVYSDSQYLIKSFNEHWIENWIKKNWQRGKNDPVKNRDLFERLLLSMKSHKVEFIWVKGHNGHPENERCDELATKAADGNQLLVDEGVTD